MNKYNYLSSNLSQIRERIKDMNIVQLFNSFTVLVEDFINIETKRTTTSYRSYLKSVSR
jgi:hypothetical protein